MRKLLALILCLLLFCLPALAEEEAPQGLSYEPTELILAAAGLRLYVPADMESYGGDMAGYDTGDRFNCFSDTFSLFVTVRESRDMSLKEYAAFYLQEGHELTDAQEEVLNGYTVQRLTNANDPTRTCYLMAYQDMDPLAFYVLDFSCDTDADVALMNEILSTLTSY